MIKIQPLRKLCITGLLTLTAFMVQGCTDTSISLPNSSPAIESSTIETGSNQMPNDEIRVHFLDVGQGDCSLIESDGHYLLIDAGERNQKEKVIEYLKDAGVTKLDYVIGTHPHSDHIGGMANVIETFDIGKIILSPKEHTTKTFEYLLDSIAAKGLKITKPVTGTEYELGNASFTILAPVNDYGNDLNNWSVGVRVDYGDTSLLFTGDAEAEAEADMINNGISLKADVLQLGHHGSSTSTSSEFLKQVQPSYGVISCGKDNSYGHPHKEVLQELEILGVQVLRTDQFGNLIMTSNGKQISWATLGS